MPLIKTIIVLAKSIKHGGHCIAGKDVISKQWVRAVSNQNGSALSNAQCKCTNIQWEIKGGSPYSPKLLQKVKINFSQIAPLINQPENFIVSTGVTWLQEYKIELNDLETYLDYPESLWGNEARINYSEIQNGNIVIPQSLYLIKITNLHLYKNQYDKRRVSFLYNDHTYDLAVTDPNFDNILANNLTLINILCISLAEHHTDGFCYKIVATIF